MKKKPVLKTSEREIGAWLRDYCKKRGYRIVKNNPTQMLGYPDRSILTSNGMSVYVELKSEGASLRAMQKEWYKWLNENAHSYLLLDVVDNDVIEMLDAYFDLLDTVVLPTFDRNNLLQLSGMINQYKRR